MFALFETSLERLPLVNKIYASVRQLLETLTNKSQKGQRVVMIDFPLRGQKASAFSPTSSPTPPPAHPWPPSSSLRPSTLPPPIFSLFPWNDLRVSQGEIHALLGQNGAGKSTLIKLVSGVEQPDAGTILLNGQRVTFHTPQEAQRAGIFTIFQELSLVPGLSVAENILISDMPTNRFGKVRWRDLRQRGCPSR